MTEKRKPIHPLPVGSNKKKQIDDSMTNDSLGTIDIADSTGSDEDRETGDAKKNNTGTRED